MTWILVVVGIATLAAILWHWGKQPAHHPVRSADDLLRAFTSFEVGASPGALLFIEHAASGRFLQFVMDQSSRTHTSLSFGFPDVEWSASLYPPMRDALTQAGFALVERQGTNGARFLDVDELTVPRAVLVAKVGLGVLGLADLSGLRTHFEGPVRPADIHVYNERLRAYRDAALHA